MICQYDCKITQSKDGWTVKTKDGGLAAHFEHSNAILKDHTEIMTRFWDDPDFDYMEEQDLALVVQSPSGTEDLLIELCGEFSVFLKSGMASTPPPPRATRSCSRTSPPFWTAKRVH